MLGKIAVPLSALLILGAALAGATTLPDACGDDKVKFDVTTAKNQPAPATPAEGKAQIVFSETVEEHNTGSCFGCKATTRVGLDGAWVGANHGNSYFVANVDPGEHHVCVNWQSVVGNLKKKYGLASFHAEAGKVYYFETVISITQYGKDMNFSSDEELKVVPLSEDDGRYRLKAWELATFKQKK
jgi:hypothetical protein